MNCGVILTSTHQISIFTSCKRLGIWRGCSNPISSRIPVMSVARDAPRLARSLLGGQLPIRMAYPHGTRFASTEAAKPANSNRKDLQELEQSSSFSTPSPSQDQVKSFSDARAEARSKPKLPGTRYVVKKEKRPHNLLSSRANYEYVKIPISSP